MNRYIRGLILNDIVKVFEFIQLKDITYELHVVVFVDCSLYVYVNKQIKKI